MVSEYLERAVDVSELLLSSVALLLEQFDFAHESGLHPEKTGAGGLRRLWQLRQHIGKFILFETVRPGRVPAADVLLVEHGGYGWPPQLGGNDG